MSSKEVTQVALALPLAERVALAQSLWQSIADPKIGDMADEVNWVIEEAGRRDQELTSGNVKGITHEQVMQAARKVLE